MENLWIVRANPVEKSTWKIFLQQDRAKIATNATSVVRLRTLLRLILCDEDVKINAVRTVSNILPARTAQLMVHRFEETIGGRAYHIEVTHVRDCWRAQLRRAPGMPTAMMPFYGTTPDAAARRLTEWLTLAHARRNGQTVTPCIKKDVSHN